MAEYDSLAIDRANQLQARRETVVLLHSSASSGRQWSALVESLQPRFEVRAVDFHGHGSRLAWSGERPLTLADDAALVKPLLWEAGGAHIVGHSYGGAIALKVATMYPHLVRSLVAYEPVLFGWLFDADPNSAAAHRVLSLGDAIRKALHYRSYRGAAEQFVNYWSGAGAWDSMPANRQHAVAERMQSVNFHFGALIRELPRSRGVAGLDMPKLFLTGERTVDSTRRIGALLRRAFPHAEHAVLPGMGHMGPMTHAADVNRRIQDFLVRRDWQDSMPEELCEEACQLSTAHGVDGSQRPAVSPTVVLPAADNR